MTASTANFSVVDAAGQRRIANALQTLRSNFSNIRLIP